MTRAVPEWHGATPDTPAPPRVRLRVFERCGGLCHISGREIGPADVWELDHIVALINGGANSESNLAPALRHEHKKKTSADVAMKSKDRRVKQKFLGIKPSKMKMAGSRDSAWKKPLNGPAVKRMK